MIDIYLPTYKPNAEYLRAALDSVLQQSSSNWQLWINDQVSDVDTKAMVSDYLSDERIHFHQNHDHPGIGANWNDCLQYGQAPYVQYIFQDDLWAPEYLERAQQILDAHPNVGFISMGHEYLFEQELATKSLYEELQKQIDDQVSEGQHAGQEFLLQWFESGLHPNLIGEPSFVMLRREVIEHVGPFHEQMVQNLDVEYWARCLTQTDWYYQPGNFGQFRVHESGASAQNQQQGKGLFERVKIMKTIITLLDGDAKKRAKRLYREQFARLIEKFIRRFGDAQLELKPGQSVWWWMAKHPLTVMRSVWRWMFV